MLEIGNNGKIVFENQDIYHLSKNTGKLKSYSKEQLIQLLTDNFVIYFNNIKYKIEKINPNPISKTIYINSSHDLDSIADFTNSIKFSVLKLCNGKNKADDISRILHIKRSTVQNYLSGLKNHNIITKEKMPKRRVERIILQLD